MKEVFDDESFLEITKKDGKYVVALAARDQNNPDMITMISVEIDAEKLKDMLK